MPMMMKVSSGVSLFIRRSTAFVARERCGAHSGQRIPTGDGVMQSGHIGRPQPEHETAVSTLGWR
jgi:hypothetical protein